MEEIMEVAILAGLNWADLEDAILHNVIHHGAEAIGNRAERYGRFNLDEISPEDAFLYFRCSKNDLPRLANALGIPEVVIGPNGHTSPQIEALCVLLRRLAYPNRWSDLEPMFGLSNRSLSEIGNCVMNIVLNNYNHLLQNLNNLNWLNQNRMRNYADALIARGSPIPNCWAFIDGTARAICRPSIDQENYYSGHKRYHALKYQSLATPDGIIINLQGPYPGRRHDAAVLRLSGLYQQLEEKAVYPNEEFFVIYGDSAYGVRELLLSPFPNTARIIDDQERRAQQAFNYHMSSIRQSVEWGFGNVIKSFAFLDFKKNQKLLLQDVAATYKTGVLLSNCLTCLYGSETSQYFGVQPPILEEYLGIL